MAVTKIKSEYLPARLVKGKTRWYILFYQTNPETGDRQQFKPTFEMNRIKDLKLRLRFAKQKVKDINAVLPEGYPFLLPDLPVDESAELGKTNIVTALEFALKVKLNTDRKKTRQMYESRVKLLCDFLRMKKWNKMTIASFTDGHALAYLDYAVVERNISNRTYNNYLSQLKALFKELIKRKYIKDCPFAEIKPKAKQEKQRREFSAEERITVAKYVHEHDKMLYYAILLQYYGFIRPIEIRRLKVKHFRISEGLIDLPGAITKNKKRRLVTIPKHIRKEIFDQDLLKYPSNYYLFGEGVRPHPTKQCGINTLNHKHKMILRELKKKGELIDIEGLSFYSWKDTGITDAGETVSLLALMQQAGHQDPKVTMVYYHKKRVNEDFRTLDKKILE